jgi:5-methylcytosine-specific restriction endonuclease McrA
MSRKTPRINIPKSVREFVLKRDNFTCKSCRKNCNEVKLTIDHIIPLSKGGSNDISNLQTLCLFCNQSKYQKIDIRFRRYFDKD